VGPKQTGICQSHNSDEYNILSLVLTVLRLTGRFSLHVADTVRNDVLCSQNKKMMNVVVAQNTLFNDTYLAYLIHHVIYMVNQGNSRKKNMEILW